MATDPRPDTNPSAQVRANDGIANVVTGIGTNRDPRSYNQYYLNRLTDQQIDAAYRSSWVMRKIVDKPATEMVREWRDWQAEADQIKLLEALERKLDLRNKIRRAEVLRGLGGCGMVLWVGSEDPALPINPRSLGLGSLRGIHVWHKSRFQLDDMETDPASDWYGYPRFYRLQTRDGRQIRLHPSRVIAFRGQEVTDIATVGWQEAFWGDSRVQSAMGAVQNLDTAQDGFAALIKDARNRRIGIPGMTAMLATAQGEAILTARMNAVAQLESMLGCTFYDSGNGDGKGGETIEDRQMTWAGIPDIVNLYASLVAAAGDMPATVMLGKSPDGQNATGASDLTIWEGTVKARQDLDLRPCIDQIDVVLIPSALGAADDAIWWKFAPLSTPTEKDEATTFFTFMQAVEKLQATGTVPDVALAKGLQNEIEERGWISGLGSALAEIPEDERFPEQEEEPVDPLAVAAEPDPNATPARRAANDRKRWALVEDHTPTPRTLADARFADADPQTLYVSRKLLNAAEFIKWAKSQGFETTTPADELHVTIAYSTTPVDWMKVGQDWSSDKDGKLTVSDGGPRIVQKLGDKGAMVLLFQSNDLKWRHDAIKEAGASFDFSEYQPHVTITYQAPADMDLSKVEPYTGPLVFGPELFAQIVKDWEKGVTEQ